MGRVNKLMVKLIGVMLLVIISGITHANLKIENGSLTLESGDVLTVEDITIISSGTLKGDSSGSASIRVNGNWSNSGTFNHNNNSVVYLTGDEVSTIIGSNIFYKLIADKQASDDNLKFNGTTVKFKEGETQIIDHTLILKGTSSSDRLIVGSPGVGAHILRVNDATVIAQYLGISNSTLLGHSGYVDPSGSNNLGNNNGWFTPRSITYSGTVFNESVANDGSISGNLTLTLSGDTYTADVVSGDKVSAANLPAGLTANFVRTSNKVITLSLTGTADNHASANNVSNLTVTFVDGAFTNEAATRVGNAVKSDLSIDFNEGSSITYSGTVFSESVANDGSISGNLTLTLSGDTYTADVVSGDKVSAANLPAGLTANFVRTSNKVITLSLTGTADNHASANNVSNLTVTFVDGAFTNEAATRVGNAVKSDLSIDFTDIEPDFFLSTNELALTEGDKGDFSVKLTIAPIANNVVIKITSNADTTAALSLASLTFTTENWDTKQIVTVIAIDDYSLGDTTATVKVSIDKDNSDAEYHGLNDQLVKITITDNDTPLSLIEGYNKGDGTTPPPPTLNIYQEAGISGVTENTLARVNAKILAQAPGDADTAAKVQAFVDLINNPPENETAFNPAEITSNDPIASQVLEKYAIELASISINENDGQYSILNLNPSDDIIIGTGRPESDLINIDSDIGPEVYIIIKASGASNKIDKFSKTDMDDQIFLWSPTNKTLVPVTISLDDAEDSSHDVGDYIGYPLGGKSLPDASNRMQIAGATDKSDQSIILWGHAKGQMVPVTRPITSASQPNSNGRYAWQVTAEDYIKSLDIGDNLVLAKSSTSLSLPLAITVTAPEVKLSLSANRNQASVGSVVTYTAQLENKSTYPLSAIAIRNDLPQGFKYVENSAHWDHDGDAQTPMVAIATSSHQSGKTLQFNLGSIGEAPTSHKLRYQLRIGSGANEGTYSNSVVVVDTNGTAETIADDTSLPGSQASADIRVVKDALFELSTVIGKVFNDVNGNGIQDEGDLPVPYARLVTSAGQQVTADANGQYHLGNSRPGRMVVRIDERSLPDQAKLIGHRSQIVDIRPGIPSKVNFAVQLPSTADSKHSVRIEQLSKKLEPSLSIGAFGPAQIDSQQQGFVEPLEIRAYSNYGAFIKKWRVVIREDFSRRVVKTFTGVGTDLFVPLYWDGSTDQGDFVDSEGSYTVEILVSDAHGREASTYRQGLRLQAPSLAQAQPSKEERRERVIAHRDWLQGLAKEDRTARSHIRVIGKSIQVTGEDFAGVRISQGNQLLVEMPSYNKSRNDVADILRGISLDTDLSQKTYVELIVPRGKIKVQVLGQAHAIKTTIADSQLSDKEKQNAKVSQLTLKEVVPRKIPAPIVEAYPLSPEQAGQMVNTQESLSDKTAVTDDAKQSKPMQPKLSSEQTEIYDSQSIKADTSSLIKEQNSKTHNAEQNSKKNRIEKSSPTPKVLPHVDHLQYKIPIINSEFISIQHEYKFVVQLQLANDRQDLLRIVEQYKSSLDINRFALVDMPHHPGSRYALIYGLYKSSMEAKRALRKVSRTVRDNVALKHSLQLRALKSMQKRQQVKHTLDKVLMERLAYVLNQINEFIFPTANAADLSDQITLMSYAEADHWFARLQIARQRDGIGYGLNPSWFESSGALSSIDPTIHRQNQHNEYYLQQQNQHPYLTASTDLDQQLYKVPAVGVEYLLDQDEYSHTIELRSGTDPDQLIRLAEEYSQTQNISRFALLIVAQEDGNYALIYGIYHNYKQAKRTLQGELPRALADSGAQIRSIKSLSSGMQAGLETVSHEADADQSDVLFEQTIDTQDLPATSDYFLVGIVDAEIAYRDIKDNVALAKSGDSRYGDKIWKDGKVQLYFKGMVGGDYLVTASIDSERERDDLFSNLDPDASYALYGDNASVNDLVMEADGALYLLVEKDLSWAKWGRLQAALDNSELASFHRSLQGAQVHYESTDSTSYGEAVTEIDGFQATAFQKASRVEFRSTGSSVYYLKHQGVIRNSLKLRVEVRDIVSGSVRSSQTLKMGDDYQFNAQSGRIMFWQPPEREAQSELLMTKHNYAQDQVYLVAHYSYGIADDWSQGISGAELKQAVGDNFIVGVTRIDEQKLNSDYSLEGLNSTIHIGSDHSVTLEYARSESRNEPQFYSDDGGLSWGTVIASSTDSELISGDAFSLHGQASLSEERTNISYYGRSITEGFDSSYFDRFRGQKSYGFDVDHRFGEQLSVRFKHHQQTELNKTVADNKDSSSTLQATYDLSNKLMLTGELQHRDNRGESTENIALQGRYQFSEDTIFSLTQQGTVNMSSGSQTRLGVNKRVSDNLMIEGTVRDNECGLSYGINGDYSLGEKLSLGAGLEQDSAGLVSARVGTGYMPNKDTIYRLSADSSALDNGRSSRGLSLGTEHRVNESTSLSTGSSLSTSGDNSRNSEDAKISYKLADGREVYGTVSHYENQGNETLDDGHEISLGGDITASWQGFFALGQGDLHRLEGILDKRRNLTIGASYVRPTEDQQKQLQGRLRYEVRQDRGMDNIDATLLDLNIRGRLNQDITLIGSLNWGRSEDLDNGSVQAQNNRFDLNAAYRPLLQDNLNIIGKYSWVKDKQPQDQIGDLGFEAQKAQVLSADTLYDLSSKWSLGAKLAVRHGEEKVQGLPWADSRKWLMASKIGYGLFEDTKLNIEYRSLKDMRAGDHKDGMVIELARRFNQKIEVAVGINYAGFSDDLGLMDYTEQRGYLRITSVLE